MPNFELQYIAGSVGGVKYKMMYLFDNIFCSTGTKKGQIGSGSVLNYLLPGSGSLTHIYGSVDSDPKDIFTSPEHWLRFQNELVLSSLSLVK
jgi:hypothetical protein